MTNEQATDRVDRRRASGGLADSLVDRLLTDIASGRLKPGDRLPPEPAMAADLHVSRPTLRQALKTLEAAGIIESRPRRGTTLAKSSPGSLGPLFGAHLALANVPLKAVAEARAVLEASMVRLAARSRRSTDLARMRAALAEQQAARTPRERIAAERRFHGAILDSARNPVLSALREVLALYFERVKLPERKGNATGREARTLRQHHAIYEAIRDRRAEDAVVLVNRHLAPTLKPPANRTRKQ